MAWECRELVSTCRTFRLSSITVEPILFLYMFSSFLQFPTFLSLVYKKTCLENFNASFCEAMDNKTFQKSHKDQQDTIQTDASHWIMLSNVGMTLPSIFVVFLFVGSWGDKVNRKVPILVPCAGALLYNLCNLLNSYYMDWPLDYLMIGPVFNGLFGGYITVLMGVYSYITHISSPKAKTTRVGIVESMTYIAGTISVFVSGLLLEATDFVIVFAIVTSCVALAAMYGFLCLKSVRPEVADTDTGNVCDLWFISALKDSVRCVRRPRPTGIKSLLVLEIIVINIMQMCTTGEGDILYLYLKRSPRSFSSTQYGYFKGAENFSRSLALLTLLPVLKHVIRMRDSSLIMLGITSKALGLVLLGLADNLTLVFLVVVFAALQGFPAAGLRANMTGMVDKEEHGRLFAIVAATESCVTLATTFIFNGWYPKTLDTFDGTCFQFAAGMCGLALLIMVYVHIQLVRISIETDNVGKGNSSDDPVDLSESSEWAVSVDPYHST